MSFAETAPLIAQLDLKGNFAPGLKKATGALGSFAAKLDQTESRAFRAGQQIGTGIKNGLRIAAVGIGFLVSQIGLGLNSLVKLEQQQAQTNAVIKSTKGIAGVSGAEVGRLAEKYESLNAVIGDEVIRSAENMLLTFTKVNKKAFEPALQAILNMNTAMGKGPEGLTSTAIQVGKALNDPVKGATALRKVGVALTEAQQKQIKTLVKQNKLYEAQQVILAELNSEFGGSFAAQGGTTAGKVAKFTDAIEDLQRALAEALLPTLGNVADALTSTLANPAVVSGVRDFGKALAGLISPANLKEGGRILGDVFSAAKSAAPVLLSAAQSMFSVVQAAVGIFRSLPPEIQKLAVGAFAINKLTGGLITNVAGGLISAVLKQLVSGVVNVNGAVVNVNGAGGLPNVLPAAGGAAGAGALGAAAVATAIGSVAVATIGLAIARQLSGDPNVVGGSRGFLPGQGPGPGMIGYHPPNWDASQRNFDRRERGGPAGVGFGLGNLALLSSRGSVADIMARGRAAGFHPTAKAIQATGERNAERFAAAQKAATDRVRDAVVSADSRSELIGIRNAIAAARQSVPIVNVDVDVTAGGIQKIVTVQNRFGPPGGSRTVKHFQGGGV